MVSSGITKDGLSKGTVDPCGVCCLKVKANSVCCLECGKWIHGRCAGVKRVIPKFYRNFDWIRWEGNIGMNDPTRPILEYAGTIYAPIISDKQLTALQVTQNQGLRIAAGCTSDTNINHIHDETKILPIEKHLRLHSSQLRQKASHPDHPLHRLTTQPQPPRLKKKTIFNNNQYTLNIDPDPTHAIDENTIKRNMKTIHTTIVQDHLSNRPINKLLNRPPPDIDKKEETLPHSTRRKLSQLRTNKSPLLMTYLHKIDPANHPAANCPLCNDPNHDSLHLFNCPDIPTTLTVWDLWTDPVGVAALLDVWGEKLGGPRAGVWDPVRAHARDGVDTTTTREYWRDSGAGRKVMWWGGNSMGIHISWWLCECRLRLWGCCDSQN